MISNLRLNAKRSRAITDARPSFRRSAGLHAALSVVLILAASGSLSTAVRAQGPAPAGGGAPPPSAPGAPSTGPGGPATAPGTTPAAPVAGTTSPGYVIAEDDVVDLQVLDHPEVNRSYQVPAEGIVDIPLVGELKIIGLTLRKLKASLATSFGKQFYHPDIILAAHPAQMTVDVVGVARNGKYPLKHNEHVLEVIATAGGLPVDRPENYKATLIRSKDGVAKQLDLFKLYNNDAAENVVMEKDDTLYIEEKAATATTVQVIGQVSHPGPVVTPRDGSILTVLQSSGGPTGNASLSTAFIKRGDTIIPIDLREYQKTGFIPSQVLQGGDQLIIPENKREYFVYGAGGSTGPKMYPDDRQLTVRTAIAIAGGSTEGVDLTKVVLLHPVAGSVEQRSVVNVQKMLKTGDMSGDLPVVPGDSIVIPPSSKPRGLQLTEVLGILGSLGGLVGLYSIFKH